jgi:light-regulated signal transduction histidine kinase (bacteriophytochrome)
MPQSRLDYAKQYDVCEQENIKATGRIQAGLYLIARHTDGAVTQSANLEFPVKELLLELDGAAPTPVAGPGYALRETKSFGSWVHHRSDSVDIFERPTRNSAAERPQETPFDVGALEAQSHGNVFKFSQLLCRKLKDFTGAERVMVYRFAPDWSGEVIAEAVERDLDPYLGLHYPPTDIPHQARALYAQTGTRHIFSTQLGDTVLLGPEDEAPLDLSCAFGRSVSSYHIEYLRNMGSESTASCALMVEGELWGLISLHYRRSRSPSLEEFQVLQTTAMSASAALSGLLDQEHERQQRRLSVGVERFAEHLDTYSDPFKSLILSNYAIHRQLNGQGVSLLMDRKLANVGRTPSPDVLVALAEHYGPKIEVGDTCWVDAFDPAIPTQGRRGLAGCAIARLSDDPNALLFVHRAELNQEVKWGGDPRRDGVPEDAARFSPRKSFKTWVEQVTGRCLPWTDFNRRTLDSILDVMRRHFGVSPRELALLIRNGYRQTVKRREGLRGSASDVIDGIQAAIAVAVEDSGAEEGRVIALNRAASDALAIAPVEVSELSVSELQAISGVDLSQGVEQSFIATVTTALDGIRECEIFIGLLFEAIDLDGADPPYRVQVFEFRDITEARRIEASLKAARDRAIQDARLRSEFFAKLGHELKTPLNGLIGLSDILVRFDQDGLPENIARKLVLIRETSGHMADLVVSTLDNAAAVHHVDPTAFEAVTLGPSVKAAKDLLEAKLRDRGLQVEIVGDETLAGFTDPRGLRQVLLNLLSNAAKFSYRDGLIRVHIEPQDGTFVSIRIEDSGPGMSEDQVQRCMTPYTRFSEGDGAGLGLSIANNLMSIMGGVIKMSSEEGVGTQASVLIPANAEHFGPRVLM